VTIYDGAIFGTPCGENKVSNTSLPHLYHNIYSKFYIYCTKVKLTAGHFLLSSCAGSTQ